MPSVTVDGFVDQFCELAVCAAQDEATDPDLDELIGRLIQQAKTERNDRWQEHVEAVCRQLRMSLATLTTPKPMGPHIFADPLGLKQRAFYADAITKLGVACRSPA